MEEAARSIDGKFLFYADRDNVPYGEKSKDDILKFVDNAVNFLVNQKVSAIVLACNTATSVAAKTIRQKYDIPIIGMEPAVKYALDLNDTQRVLVTATPVTVSGQKMQELIGRVDNGHLVDLLALPGLVKFAESGEFESENVTNYLREKLFPYDLTKYSALVLGCTHFNYFKDTLRSLLPKTVSLIDGNDGTIRELKRRLKLKDIDNKTFNIEYFYSGRKVEDKSERERLQRCLHRLEKMRKIK